MIRVALVIPVALLAAAAVGVPLAAVRGKDAETSTPPNAHQGLIISDGFQVSTVVPIAPVQEP